MLLMLIWLSHSTTRVAQTFEAHGDSGRQQLHLFCQRHWRPQNSSHCECGECAMRGPSTTRSFWRGGTVSVDLRLRPTVAAAAAAAAVNSVRQQLAASRTRRWMFQHCPSQCLSVRLCARAHLPIAMCVACACQALIIHRCSLLFADLSPLSASFANT